MFDGDTASIEDRLVDQTVRLCADGDLDAVASWLESIGHTVEWPDPWRLGPRPGQATLPDFDPPDTTIPEDGRVAHVLGVNGVRIGLMVGIDPYTTAQQLAMATLGNMWPQIAPGLLSKVDRAIKERRNG